MNRTGLWSPLVTCAPTLGWWYWASEDGRARGITGIFGPFKDRESARRDRRERLRILRRAYPRYRTPYIAPEYAKAFVREENGRPTWRRVRDTIGAQMVPPEGLFS